MLFHLISLAVIAPQAFAPINHAQLKDVGSQFDFVVLGDNRPAGKGLPPTSIFKSLLADVEMIRPSFVLSSGDLIYGNEEEVGMYRHELDTMQDLLKGLDVPFFNAPGNHEIAGKEAFVKEYTSRFGPLYGSFSFGGWRFFALCTDQVTKASSVSDDEMTWLKQTLDSSAPTCIFMHHPVFARVTNTDKSDKTVEGAADLHELFKSRGVRFVFQGHDHVFNHQQHDGIEYYISGGAGAPLDALPQDGGFFHFMIVHVNGTTATVDVVPAGALEVSGEGSKWAVANYADVDLTVRNLVVTLPAKPTSVSAIVDKKSGPVPVDASIVSTVQNRTGWETHVSVVVTKHRKTALAFALEKG